MFVTEKATPVDGTIVAGSVFTAVDEDSASAVFERNGRVCGIIYEMGSNRPYLRCSPGYQIPPFARNRSAWLEYMWNLDDDRAFDIRLDEDDGELTYIHRDDNLLENLDSAIENVLEFLTGDELYDAIVEYVRGKMTD